MAIGDGKYIAIRFSQPLIGDVSGLTPTPVGGYTDAPLTIQSVAASSEYSTSYKATNLTDGSTSTYWRPAAADLATAYVQFMLPQAASLRKFRYYNGSSTYYIKNFTLYGSADALDWTAIYSGTGTSTVGWQEHEISATPGTPYKYYKLAVTSYNSTYYYIYEIEVKTHKPIGNERAFTVVGQRYDMMPEGSLVPYTGIVESVGMYDDAEHNDVILLTLADNGRINNAEGDLTVAYDKTLGTLAGAGGAVESFSHAFTPASLEKKPNPNDAEHIAASVAATGTLTRIYYSDSAEAEHIAAAIAATGTLINVSDI